MKTTNISAACQRRAANLQGNRAVERNLPGEIPDTHAARTQALLDAKIANNLRIR